MVFSSPVFLFVFLPITLICYGAAALTGRMRIKNTVLLLCSVLFYACGGAACLLLLMFSVVVNWAVGLQVDRTGEDRKRTRIFIAGVVFNLGILFVFKYLNLIGDTAAGLVGVLTRRPVSSPIPHIVLPIGISFFTFQILSYQIDLYRRQVPCQKNLWNLALYIMLFPQLIAGPIVRYSDVQKEISVRRTDLKDIYEGLFRFMVGFSKKILLANYIGQAADMAFGLEGGRGMVYAWGGLFFYSLQIYMDFWAYSDMAIGLGRIFGFRFPENFNHPYISKSIREFWRRWHITLSTWFRDYVYIPLGGSRKGRVRTCRNLFFIFALTGIWHGASWTYLLWGCYFGVFLIAERLWLGDVLKKIPSFFGHLYVLVVVAFGWVLFRSDSMAAAAAYIKDLFSFTLFGTIHSRDLAEFVLGRKFIVLFLAAVLYCTPFFAMLRHKMEEKNLGWAADGAVLTVFFLSVCEMMAGGYNPFIYFRF